MHKDTPVAGELHTRKIYRQTSKIKFEKSSSLPKISNSAILLKNI